MLSTDSNNTKNNGYTIGTAKDEKGNTKVTIENIDLPKYDALGRIIEYRLRETKMSIFDSNGNEITQEIKDNTADFSKIQSNADKYTCTVKLDKVDYKQSQWLKDTNAGDSPHHSGDEYFWAGKNTRKDDCDISVYKVWRDGGLPVNKLNAYNAHRPDICFHLYRVSQRDLRKYATESNSTPAYVDWMKEKIKSEDDIIAEKGETSEENKYKYEIERVNDDYLWTTSTVEGQAGTVVNNWLWKCEISKQMPRYDEYGSPYIYFLFEELRANADKYKASYCNKTVDQMETEEMPNGEGTTTEKTFAMTEGLESGFLLIVDGETGPFTETNAPSAQNDEEDNSQAAASEETSEYGEYYSRIVVNTRQRSADVSGEKIWNLPDGLIVGDKGIPYEKMPDVKLKLYRDKASVGENGKYVAASFKDAIKIDELTAKGEDKFKFRFPSSDYPTNHVNYNKTDPDSLDNAKLNDLITVVENGENIKKLPRYDEYGYRYSYWIVEEPLANFTSPNMGEKDDKVGTEGSTLKPQAGVFDLSNTYKTEPPYVKISLTKEWRNWDNIPADKKNLIVTFNLHAVIADEYGQPLKDNDGNIVSDEIFATKEIKVDNGNATPANLTFTNATQGYLAGSQLPYYGPNGQPYLYYVEEAQPNGYTVTSKVVKSGETAATTGNKTDLFRPVLINNNTEAAASVEFTNEYHGDLNENYSLSIEKTWNHWKDKDDKTFDEGKLSSLQPSDEIKVKLYRQWKLGGGDYGWEQVTGPDVTNTETTVTTWGNKTDDGIFTLTATDNWRLSNLTGLYKTAPNKEPYEYFVVEQGDAVTPADDGGFHGYFAALSPDIHPDVSTSDTKPEGASFNTAKAAGMIKRCGYSKSVILGSKEGETSISVQPVNDLLYKKVSYTKKWMMKLSKDGQEKEIEASRMQFLSLTGALPEKLHFVVQYQVGDSGAWNYLPASGNIFTRASASAEQSNLTATDITNSVHRTYPLSNSYRLEGDKDESHKWKPRGSWNYLPAYTWNGTHKTEVNYRVVEVMEFADKESLVIRTPDTTGADTDSDSITTSVKKAEAGVTAPLTADTYYSYTNTMKLKPLVVRKVWENDNANRDDTRPPEIKITIKSKTEPSHSFDIILKQTDVKKTGVSDEQKGNIYESQPYYVPANTDLDSLKLALTAEEIGDIPGYDKAGSVDLKEETIDSNHSDGAKRFVFTATNKLIDTTRKKINLTAEKTWAGDGENDVVWADAENSLRPAKITFTLQYRYKLNSSGNFTKWANATPEATGIEVNAEQTVTKLNDGNYQPVKWENVYQYYTEDKTAIPIPMQYRVVEEMYNASGDPIEKSVQPYKPSTGEFTRDNKGVTDKQELTVTNTLKTVQVQAIKKWMGKDGNKKGELSAAQLKKLDAQGLLPDYIRFNLYYKTGDSNTWSEVKTADNEPVSEIVKVMASNTDGDAVKTLLTKDGEVRTYTSDKKLPQFDKNGKEIEYRLVETGIYYGDTEPTDSRAFEPVTWKDNQNFVSGNVGDFEVSVAKGNSATTAINTNTLNVTELKVTKVWNDENNRDNNRPNEIKVYLIGTADNKTVYSETKTISESDKWECTFQQLPTCWHKEKIEYSVSEDRVPGYSTLTITRTAANGFTITNTLREISIRVTKVWKDVNDQDNKQPDSVTIHLFADGNDTGRTLTLNKENEWKGTFEALPAYKNKNYIHYTISENPVADYTAEITGTASSGFTVTNTHAPETITISGTKTWVDDNDKAGARPDSITLRIHGKVDGKEINLSDELSVITVTEENNWTWSVEKLPKYDQGKEITYTVTEDWVKDYQTQINGYNITNTYVPPEPLPTTVNFSVVKKWNDEDNKDGLRPAQVFIRLYADGADTGKILTLSEANHWAGSFTSLDEYKDGKKIHYTIKEDSSEGYTPEITGSTAAGFVVTNTHIPGTVDVSGKKVWKDNGDKAGKRPDSITLRVHIFADGQEVETRQVKVTAKDDWKWSLGELPEYKDGKKMTYTVTEDRVKGYQSRVDGFDVYNTYMTTTTTGLSIPVLKSWNDGNNRDRIRPASVIIRLYADGKYTGKMLTLSEKNGWKGSFDGLKESKDGKKIVYSIKEDEIRWYTATISGSMSSGFVVSNYHRLGDLPPDEGLWWTDPSGKNPNGPNGSGNGNGRYPGTGDDSSMLPWMALMVSSAGALTALWNLRRKKKNR